MSVTSYPGEGTTFQLSYLRKSEPERRGTVALDETRGQRLGAGSDDESYAQNLAQTALKKYGCTVRVAEDAVSAMDILQQALQPIAVVLLDLSMPRMNAQQAVQRIQSGWPGTRIVLSSGYDEEEVLGSFIGTQLAGFLQKPYTPAQLAEKIRAAMALGEGGFR